MRLLRISEIDIGQAYPAFLSSLLLFLAFPPLSIFPLSLVAMVPLLWAMKGWSIPRSFFISWTAGTLFFVLLLHWIVLNPAVELWVKPLLYLGTLLIGMYLGLYWALPAALAKFLEQRFSFPGWLSFPALMTLSDFWRTQGFLGFPWGSPGYSLARCTEAIQMAAWGGFYSLTFWVLLINGLIFRALTQSRPGSGSAPIARWFLTRSGPALIILLVPILWGRTSLDKWERFERSSPSMSVALIQGNIDQGQRWDRKFMEYNWQTYRRLTWGTKELRPDLVVWPETAMPFYLRYEGRYLAEMMDLTDRLDCAVLTGVPDVLTDPRNGAQTYYNSAFLFLPGKGLAGEYAKSHLVPFGERFPLKDKIPFLRDVNFGEGEWSPGVDTVLLLTDQAPISCLICFESIFPGIARNQVNRGSRLLVNITNDGWFGRSGAARQHADMAVLRAVEQRRSIARCANSGVSMFITPSGRIHQPTELYRTAVIHQKIPLMDVQTFYARHGDLFILILLSFTALGPLVCYWFKRKPLKISPGFSTNRSTLDPSEVT